MGRSPKKGRTWRRAGSRWRPAWLGYEWGRSTTPPTFVRPPGERGRPRRRPCRRCGSSPGATGNHVERFLFGGDCLGALRAVIQAPCDLVAVAALAPVPDPRASPPQIGDGVRQAGPSWPGEGAEQVAAGRDSWHGRERLGSFSLDNVTEDVTLIVGAPSPPRATNDGVTETASRWFCRSWCFCWRVARLTRNRGEAGRPRPWGSRRARGRRGADTRALGAGTARLEVGGLREPSPRGRLVGIAAGELGLVGAGDPVQASEASSERSAPMRSNTAQACSMR